jgi:uncharacterized protein YndB with AHSA1/START domain
MWSTSSELWSQRSEKLPGGDGIRAERLVAGNPESVFGFLSDLENHWLLADRFIEVLELERDGAGRPAHGAKVRMRGPLGLQRDVVTRVLEVEPNARMAGTAEVGPNTLAKVSWTLHPENGGTRVRLAAKLERASLLDRALLAAGGAPWMRRRFGKILETLDGVARLDGRGPMR